MESQAGGSRRQFLFTIAMSAGAAILPRLGWAAESTDPRTAGIVAKTIGIDTHNHVDVILPAVPADHHLEARKPKALARSNRASENAPTRHGKTRPPVSTSSSSMPCSRPASPRTISQRSPAATFCASSAKP